MRCRRSLLSSRLYTLYIRTRFRCLHSSFLSAWTKRIPYVTALQAGCLARLLLNSNNSDAQVYWVEMSAAVWCPESDCVSSMLLILYSSAPTHHMRYHHRVVNSRALGELDASALTIKPSTYDVTCCPLSMLSETSSCRMIPAIIFLQEVASSDLWHLRCQSRIRDCPLRCLMSRTECAWRTYRLDFTEGAWQICLRRPYRLYLTTVYHLLWYMTWHDRYDKYDTCHIPDIFVGQISR